MYRVTSVQSVDRYVKRISTAKKQKLSNDLSGRLGEENEFSNDRPILNRSYITDESISAEESVESSSKREPTATIEKNGCIVKIYV